MGGLSLASGLSAAGAMQKLGASTIPFIIAPTGSMANNGAITLGTALPTIYAQAYIFLPAGAIAAGSLAGWYYAVMSSTTVGQVFNNTYASGAPSVPTTPTPFVTAGPGAYTGVITAVTGPQITIPANSIGPNGQIKIWQAWSCNASANVKNYGGSIGGQTFQAAVFGANVSNFSVFVFYPRPGNILLTASTAGGFGLNSQASAASFLAVNLALPQIVAQVGQLAVATDYLVMEALLIEAVP